MSKTPKYRLRNGQAYGFPGVYRFAEQVGQHVRMEGTPFFHVNLLDEVGG